MVRVHPHALTHGLSAEEVSYAWEHALRMRERHGTDDPPLWIAVGPLPDGRIAEMVGFLDVTGTWCVFHAMTPPTKKFLDELGLAARRAEGRRNDRKGSEGESRNQKKAGDRK